MKDLIVAFKYIELKNFLFSSTAGRRSEADLVAEAGARLTCHLLLRLFKTTETPQTSSFSVGKYLALLIYALHNTCIKLASEIPLTVQSANSTAQHPDELQSPNFLFTKIQQ
jgi:hypothetical protein